MPNPGRLRRLRVRALVASLVVHAAQLGYGAVLLRPSPSSAAETSTPAARAAFGMTFECTGRTSEGGSLPSFASGAETRFQVSATFGEGAIVALVDPETSAIREPLDDAESTSGRLGFQDGEETTIVWTRMSGGEGALVGEAIMSDGDVLALSIERASEGTAARPFALFAAASASLFRGACMAIRPR